MNETVLEWKPWRVRKKACGVALGLPLLMAVVATRADAALPPGYYDSVDDQSARTLRDSLHEIIDDHTRFPYTSSEADTWDILEQADQDRDDGNRITTLYRNASYPKQGGGNDFYNREHSWPRSYGFPDNDASVNYPFTDAHHLFLADAEYNSHRSNKPYEDCDASCVSWVTEVNDGRGGAGGGYPGDSNWTDGQYTNGRWEVWSGRRGDIARAMMYMDLRYEGGAHGITGATEPDLILTDDRALIDSGNTGENEGVAYMGMLSTLLRWHREDPVDAAEIQHHEAVASFQGNRNPFIDHQDWAECVFLDVCGVVINPGMNDAWYNPETAGQGFFINVFPDIGKVFVAMFTYEIERPPVDAGAILGEPGHRWFTALGDYAGNRAELEIELTSGGVFDSSEPAVTQVYGGTLTLEFSDCNSGVVTYDIPSAGVLGVIPISRIASDNAELCRTLNMELQTQP